MAPGSKTRGMFDSTALRYFAEVVRSGSLSAAAEALCISPSAIGRQISLLEEELDAPLFERKHGRRQSQLTTAGEHLIGYVRNIESETRRVRSDVQSLKGMQKGRIRFGMTEGFNHCLVPELLARFHEKYPAITFDVEVANTPRLVELLAESQLDLILGFNPQPAADVRIAAEVRLPRHVIVPAGHPLAEREFVRLSDCAAYAMAMPTGTLTATAIAAEMFADAKIKPRAVLRSNSYELLQSAAMAGMALCLANGQFLEHRSASDTHRLVPVRDARVKPTRVVIAVREHRTLPVAAQTFLDALKQQLQSVEQA